VKQSQFDDGQVLHAMQSGAAAHPSRESPAATEEHHGERASARADTSQE
jgi:hypothetical protein